MLVFRQDRGLYQARFRGGDDELLAWHSTGLTSKTAARALALKEIKRGSVTSTRANFARYAEGWWTVEHPYVQGRIARGHRLVETYLVAMRGHLANHVLPYFKDRRLADIGQAKVVLSEKPFIAI